MNTGSATARSLDATYVTRGWGGFPTTSSALSRPIRRLAPPHRTTPASGRGSVGPTKELGDVDGGPRWRFVRGDPDRQRSERDPLGLRAERLHRLLLAEQ